VKREADSRGGSQSMHEQVAEGSELHITVPRNGFPLKRTGRKPVLIAGGIGITPILSMAQALRSSDAAFELHYFVRGDDHIPFKDRFKALESATQLHKGLDADATKAAIKNLLAKHGAADIDAYVCGPGPMIEAVKELAQQHGLSEDAIRFEYFENAMATQ